MKATASTRQCFSRARGIAHAGALQVNLRAHTRARRPVAARGAQPDASGPQPQYREAPAAPAVREVGRGGRALARPRVLHVDKDFGAFQELAQLLVPEANVVHAGTVADARRLLATEVFSLVVLDPALPEGDPRTLLPMLSGTPLLVYSAHQPDWRGTSAPYLPKPWTTPRELWIAIAGMLGIPSMTGAGE